MAAAGKPDVDAVCREAQARIVDDDAETAVELLTKALAAAPDHVEARLVRAAAFAKLDKFQESLEDADKVLAQDANQAKGHLRRGIALMGLGRHADALAALSTADRLAPGDRTVLQWLRKAEAHAPAPAPAPAQAPAPAPPVPSAPASQAKPPSIKHDWFQSDTYVAVNVMIKNVKPEDATIVIEPKSLSVTVKLPLAGSEYNLELDLAGEVVPAESKYEFLSTKIEIKMKKAVVGLKWPGLEASAAAAALPTAMASAAAPAAKPPAPYARKKDWDGLERAVKKEEEEEQLDGEAALQKLFRQIYANATDEQRRAMNKSFVESAGTTLSTNWEDVGSRHVDVAPPAGTDVRKWEA